MYTQHFDKALLDKKEALQIFKLDFALHVLREVRGNVMEQLVRTINQVGNTFT
jgi:hypothetical protein